MKTPNLYVKWEVVHHGKGGNESIEIQTETGLPIATVCRTVNILDNAVLLAAAPELFRALKATADTLAWLDRQIGNESFNSEIKASLNIALCAILKAQIKP